MNEKRLADLQHKFLTAPETMTSEEVVEMGRLEELNTVNLAIEEFKSQPMYKLAHPLERVLANRALEFQKRRFKALLKFIDGDLKPLRHFWMGEYGDKVEALEKEIEELKEYKWKYEDLCK